LHEIDVSKLWLDHADTYYMKKITFTMTQSHVTNML